ncbi:hypothetical protein PHMEG_00027080 [Phytophthora megakarya]|uniref:Uncharacterized protein n=1 Tax=Phytophthora megakarya TaxID=4795 RepID=A0A225V889_9STRA|nr:hypothetical protein PHMEG_00027080 [Phytophthora megakarya]
MWQNKRGWKTDKDTQVRKQIRHDPKKKPTHTAPDRGCLKCGEEHWVAKCPEASDTEKRELPKQFHKNKGRPGEKNMKRLRDDK